MNFRPIGIVIHHTESADKVGFDGNGVRAILSKRGLRGYHLLHETIDGVPWTSILNPLNRPAQHVAHHNSEYLGFAFVANSVPSDAVLQHAAGDVAALLDTLGLPRTAIIRHCDVPDNSTDCPGRNFPWEKFRAMVRQA